jgi:hypothetical protein
MNHMQSKSWWHRLTSMFQKKPQEPPAPPKEDESDLCCSGVVHVAYRGLSDDRMYMTYNRKWPEVRYFRPNGLRVYCAECRRRLL